MKNKVYQEENMWKRATLDFHHNARIVQSYRMLQQVPFEISRLQSENHERNHLGYYVYHGLSAGR